MRTMNYHDVTEDCMSPWIIEGDVIASQSIDIDSFIEPGEVYILETDQGEIITKLHPDPDYGDSFICNFEKSDAYPPFRINKKSILYIGKMMGLVRNSSAIIMSNY